MELPLVVTAVNSNIPTGLLIVGWPIDCWTVVGSAVHIFRSLQCFKLHYTTFQQNFHRGGGTGRNRAWPSNAPPTKPELAEMRDDDDDGWGSVDDHPTGGRPPTTGGGTRGRRPGA